MTDAPEYHLSDVSGVPGTIRAGDVEMAPPHWGRPLSKFDALSIFQAFDPDAFGVVHVWRRPELPVGGGRYVVVDGQHRLYCVVECFGYSDEMVNCVFLDGLDDARAAAISRRLQSRRHLSTFDDYRAGNAEGDPRCVGVDRALTQVGLSLVRGGAVRNQVSAVGTLLKLEDLLGDAGLTSVLTVARDAWEGDPSGFHNDILRALAVFLKSHPAVDLDRLTGVLQRRTPARWRMAVAAPQHIGHLAQQLVAMYNSRLTEQRQLLGLTADQYRAAARRKEVGPRGPRVATPSRSVSATYRSVSAASRLRSIPVPFPMEKGWHGQRAR